MAHLRVKGENVVCLPRVHQSPSKQHGPRFVFLSLSFKPPNTLPSLHSLTHSNDHGRRV